MTISQISSNARAQIQENQIQENQNKAARIESIYAYLVATQRERVVHTLISTAMKGRNSCYINFDRNIFCFGINRPSSVLRETLTRIINSDPRLVGVTIDVWNNWKNTVHFRW